MKKRIRSMPLLAVLILTTTSWMACDTVVELPGTLSGVVREEGTETPLPDITVALNSVETTTDQNGRFAFSDVPVGASTLQVSTTGFDTYTKEIDVQAGDNSLDVFLMRAFALQFNHASILVHDLEQSAMFYRDILRFEELETPFGSEAPVRFFSIGDHQEVHMVQGDNSVLEFIPRMHLAFATQDFDAYLSFLTDKGVKYGTYGNGRNGAFQTRPDGVRQVYFQEPSGNWIEINDINSTGTGQSSALRFNHTAPLGLDFEKMLLFYKNILRFKRVPSPFPQIENMPHAFLSIGDKQELHLVGESNGELASKKEIHLAYRLEKFDAYLSFLRDNGIDYGDYAGTSGAIEIRRDGLKQVYFQDPAGNWIEVNNAQ